MIIIKKPEEIELMREAGKIGASVMEKLILSVKPGISTLKLNGYAEALIDKYHAYPAFKGFSPPGESKKYPAGLCVSINEEVVHGIPSSRRVKEGDIVSLDLGIFYKGYYTDLATTVGVGNIDPSDKRLIATTRKALEEAIKFLKAGRRLGDLGFLIQRTIESKGFSVIRDLVGHGVGKELHEEPSVPNYGRRGEGIVLKEGMTIAVEPMASSGKPEVKIKKDGWTIKTCDGSHSAHFEETILIKKEGCEVLTKNY